MRKLRLSPDVQVNICLRCYALKERNRVLGSEEKFPTPKFEEQFPTPKYSELPLAEPGERCDYCGAAEEDM